METRYFQWLLGDRQNEICIFDHVEEDDGNIYVCFTDKSRVNEELISPLNEQNAAGKMVAEIDHPNNCWKFSQEWIGRQEERWEKNEAQELVCVDPFIPGKQVLKLTPPRKSAPKISNYGIIAKPISEVEFKAAMYPPTTLLANLDKTDPVFIMMSKSKKVDNDVEMTITIAMPPKSLYEVAKESFDDGGDKVVEYIIENIQIKDIQEALKIAIKNMYES